IAAANQFIMEKNRAAIAELLPAAAVSVRGHTDLCMGDLKFAGNSQRRRKHFLLFHGTLLLDCDLSLISELLLMPSLQPDYRASRPHESFVTNLKLPAQKVKAAMVEAWEAQEPAPALPAADIGRLVAEKYSSKSWNLKF
ncbi:MAG TPA: hypothetical protein VK815_11950, partial [Candidatus Acidoferrales bacterium]|nr:hypothetical protein [Candidatus Acidoferrales bacterium]